MTLNSAVTGKEYVVSDILTDDEEMRKFLFSLGCYSGEPVTVVSRRKKNCVISVKDARYNIDPELGASIHV